MEPNKATAEEITFYSYWLPALAPGEYSVTVKPDLTAGETLFAKAVSETFHVGGPRYALTGSEAYSCYPAPGQIGQFYDTLPHIVFDRCTLPWERTIDGTDPTVEPTDHDPCPWLALILLTDTDFSSETDIENGRVPPIETRTLAELLTPAKEGVIVPELTLDAYDDKDKDLCQTIDLPAKVFGTVMPRKQDLPYLAHVREVKTDNKETWSLLKEGKFSVVICNRFPKTQPTAGGEKDWGIVNTVCLVSLEGWGKYLDEADNKADGSDDGKMRRLLVLGSWRFTCQGSSAFKSQMKHLDDSRLLGRPPLGVDGPAPHGDEGKGFDYVNGALRMGFAPVNHDLRNDDKTISWYRGPLVPMLYERYMSDVDISCGDAALRYNPETGMFDASFAAAWQLGRLLALQDQAFAQALHRFRTNYQRWVRTTNTVALRKMDEQQNKKADKLTSELGTCTNMRDEYANALRDAGYLGANGGAPPDPASDSPPSIPTTVQNWLGQAMLLYGVPFNYLVPDAEMLPAESIRFFYVNPEWINCLLQGACSVGRTSATDELADQLLRAHFFAVSEKLASELRSSAKQAADRRRTAEKDSPVLPPTARSGWEELQEVLHWPLSGYLLRSAAVESWIGLEARAIGVGAKGPLQILRMDRLAPDILLCIYNGKVTEIEVKQPPEAIHFGAASKAAGGHEKTGLRKIKGDPQTRGDMCEGTNTVDVPTSKQRVVNVNTMAMKIKNKLIEIQQLAEKDSFTSAEFALEMIESPAKVTFWFYETTFASSVDIEGTTVTVSNAPPPFESTGTWLLVCGAPPSEIMKVTAVDGKTLTVTRAFDTVPNYTGAQKHPVGERCAKDGRSVRNTES